MLTETQQQAREGKVGSSDAPVICGVSPYKTPLALFYQFTGAIERYTKEETKQQKIGQRLEPVIADLAAEELNLKIRRCAMHTHKKYPWLIAHSDFEIVSNPKGPGLLEIKNRSGESPWESVPEDIEIQVRHQLAASDREWAYVACLFRFGEIKQYELVRDREIEEYLIQIESQFLLRVEKGEPPDADWEKDHNVIRQLYPSDSGRRITLDEDDIRTVCAELVEAKAKLKEYEEYKEAAEAFLKDKMQDASEAVVPGFGSLTWQNTKDQQRFDVDAFRQAHPLMAADYTKTVPGSRRFMVKPRKDAP